MPSEKALSEGIWRCLEDDGEMENFLEIMYLKNFHFPATILFQEKLPLQMDWKWLNITSLDQLQFKH